MKAILISIKPKYAAKILNVEKTIEIRKTMPKCELPIDVYIYCTKDGYLHLEDKEANIWSYSRDQKYTYVRSGKVVAKFRLMKVEKIDVPYPAHFHEVEDMYKHITEGSLLSLGSLHAYLGINSGYAWRISDLQIFGNPKELSEFGVKRAPQSWMFIEERKAK